MSLYFKFLTEGVIFLKIIFLFRMNIFRIMQLRKLYLVFLGIISFIIIFVLISRNNLIDDVDRKFRLSKIDELIKSQTAVACKQPNLPVHAPEIMKFVHGVPKIDCSHAREDWVKCEGGICEIPEHIKIKYGPIKCSFTDIIRVDDHQLTDGDTTDSESHYKLQKSDVVKISCTSSESKWSGTMTSIRQDPKIWNNARWDSLPMAALKMNILMFGFDSLSRNSFIRKLPKSYAYMTETLDTIVLKGYNIVGDGTPQALIPILTGKTELELPDARKRIKNSKYVNAYPFIWDDFKDNNYVTAFFEDVPELSTFTYRLNGFDEVPTDHYMRPYYLASLSERSKWPHLCTGQYPRHRIMLNAIKDFFAYYKDKPKFLFGFHGELSHDDYNLIGAADDDVLEFIKDLYNTDALNNTIFIFMADHGHRFAEIRNTMQGKQEERLPFFSFTLPKWFSMKHPQAYKNLRNNVEKLTTPFDIYTTLKSTLNLSYFGPANLNERSVSLFTEVPKERSCADAYIEPHWCACLDWHQIDISEPIVERLSQTLLSKLNNYTSDHREICAILTVSKVEWVTKMVPNENLVKFNKNADKDGFVADLSAKTEIKNEMYQIKVTLVPGNSIFEASLTHVLDSDEIALKLSDVSRINMYRSQAKCVEKRFPHLRKYCYCKNNGINGLS